MISDRFLYSPTNLGDRRLRKEVAATKAMIADIRSQGIALKWVNPVGFCMHKFPARNHKKMVVIDNRITYLGGINFSEHNFHWHDMMLRIDDTEIARFFSEDFRNTWDGRNIGQTRHFDDIEFIMFNGKNNDQDFERILSLLDRAEKSICIESPYLTFPFFENLACARKRGVDVTIITPENNNKKLIGDYILWEADRADLTVQLYRGRMTHLKAILIDDRTLIMGSTNFDFLCYSIQQEIAAITSNRELVAEFKSRIIDVDLANSVRFEGEIDRAAGEKLARRLRSLGRLAVTLNRP